MTKQRSFRGLLIYLLVGITALFSLYLLTLSTLSTDSIKLEQMSEMGFSGPPEIFALLSIIPTFILLIIALTIGLFTAHKVGLKSVIIHPNARVKLKSERIKGIKIAITLGLFAGIVIRGFDYLFQSLLPNGITKLLQPYDALEFIAAILYGGVVEELLLRFGVMSLLVFIFWKLFDRKSAKPSSWVFISAISVAALIFAVGQYGATALATDMTPFIWLRMIILNGLPGFFFGWIYWKHNLELAILAHIFTHISMNVLMLILSFSM